MSAVGSSAPSRKRDSLAVRAGQLLASSLPRELVPAFEAEVAEGNRRRLRNLLPLFTLGHLLHVAAFYSSGAARERLDPRSW